MTEHGASSVPGTHSAATSSTATARRRRGGSLSTPLVTLVVAVNLAAFCVLTWVAVSLASRERTAAQEARDELVSGLVAHILDERSQIRTRWLLELSFWAYQPVEDVVVVQAPVFDASSGRWSVPGVFVNPQGRTARPVDFDEQALLADVAAAVEGGERIERADGSIVLPITEVEGRRWGACWYRPPPVPGFAIAVFERILPWFAVTLLTATLVTVVAVRRLVIAPIADLAKVAARVEGGDLATRVAEPRRDDELAALVRSFNAMTSEVQHFSQSLEREVAAATDQARRAEAAAMTQRRLAATGELAAGIAHEINNPVGGLLNAVERLERADLSEDRRREYFALVRSGLERIRETVGRLLRLAPRVPEVGPVHLASPIGDALGLVRHRAAEQNVAFVAVDAAGRTRDAFATGALDLWRDVPRIRGAANELGQAVLNLFVNSLDALEGRPRGEVRVSMADGPGVVRVTVADDGPGVDDEVLARAADAFFTTKGQGRGTGLGLAIVHNVADAHGGRVLLWSRPGQGFRVELEFPVHGDAAKAPEDGERDGGAALPRS